MQFYFGAKQQAGTSYSAAQIAAIDAYNTTLSALGVNVFRTNLAADVNLVDTTVTFTLTVKNFLGLVSQQYEVNVRRGSVVLPILNVGLTDRLVESSQNLLLQGNHYILLTLLLVLLFNDSM